MLLLTLLLTLTTPCADESANLCTWDATVQGNGQGSSYIAFSDDLIIYF